MITVYQYLNQQSLTVTSVQQQSFQNRQGFFLFSLLHTITVHNRGKLLWLVKTRCMIPGILILFYSDSTLILLLLASSGLQETLQCCEELLLNNSVEDVPLVSIHSCK